MAAMDDYQRALDQLPAGEVLVTIRIPTDKEAHEPPAYFVVAYAKQKQKLKDFTKLGEEQLNPPDEKRQGVRGWGSEVKHGKMLTLRAELAHERLPIKIVLAWITANNAANPFPFGINEHTFVADKKNFFFPPKFSLAVKVYYAAKAFMLKEDMIGKTIIKGKKSEGDVEVDNLRAMRDWLTLCAKGIKGARHFTVEDFVAALSSEGVDKFLSEDIKKAIMRRCIMGKMPNEDLDAIKEYCAGVPGLYEEMEGFGQEIIAGLLKRDQQDEKGSTERTTGWTDVIRTADAELGPKRTEEPVAEDGGPNVGANDGQADDATGATGGLDDIAGETGKTAFSVEKVPAGGDWAGDAESGW